MITIKTTGAVIAATVAAAIIAAPSAQASQWSYVSFLDDNGVSYSTVSGVIDLGKQVCHELRGGTSLWAVGRHLTGPLGYTGPEAGAIVAGAVAEMCPDAAEAVQQDLDAAGPATTNDQIA